MRVTIPFVLAALATACSGSPSSPSATASSRATGASQIFSLADEAPTGDARNSCPSDAPSRLSAGGTGQRLGNGLSAVEFGAVRVANAVQYEFAFERDQVNVFGSIGPSVKPDRPLGTIYLGHGTYRVRVRAINPCGPQAWSGFVTFSVADR